MKTPLPETPPVASSNAAFWAGCGGAASSEDVATTWTSAIRVNDDTSDHNSQFHPRVAVDQTTGSVAVSWYDCRNDPNNVKVQYFAAVSRDRFATSPRSFLLNWGQSDCRNLAVLNNNAFFDYTGLAFNAGWLYPVWSDNSNSTGNNPDGTSRLDIVTCKFAY